MDIKKILDYINKLTSKKNTFNLIVIFLIGVLILLVADFFSGTTKSISTETSNVNSSNTDKTAEKELSNYEADKKTELENILNEIEGIGKVKVMIQFAGGEELVPAVNDNKDSSVTKETDNQGGERTTKSDNSSSSVVMENDGGDNKPVIVKTIHPKINSVIIVADGADNEDIRKQIIGAVSALFGIPNYEVLVYQMKK